MRNLCPVLLFPNRINNIPILPNRCTSVVFCLALLLHCPLYAPSAQVKRDPVNRHPNALRITHILLNLSDRGAHCLICFTGGLGGVQSPGTGRVLDCWAPSAWSLPPRPSRQQQARHPVSSRISSWEDWSTVGGSVGIEQVVLSPSLSPSSSSSSSCPYSSSVVHRKRSHGVCKHHTPHGYCIRTKMSSELTTRRLAYVLEPSMAARKIGSTRSWS